MSSQLNFSRQIRSAIVMKVLIMIFRQFQYGMPDLSVVLSARHRTMLIQSHLPNCLTAEPHIVEHLGLRIIWKSPSQNSSAIPRPYANIRHYLTGIILAYSTRSTSFIISEERRSLGLAFQYFHFGISRLHRCRSSQPFRIQSPAERWRWVIVS